MGPLDTTTNTELFEEMERRFDAFVFYGQIPTSPDHLDALGIPLEKGKEMAATSVRYTKGSPFVKVGLAECLKFDLLGSRMTFEGDGST